MPWLRGDDQYGRTAVCHLLNSETMTRYRGHFLNWVDTRPQTLRRYVPTVAAAIWPAV